MSIRIMSQVWESTPLAGADLIVMLALADAASDEGICWPSWSTLQRKARIARSTLSGVLKNLETLGYISRDRNNPRASSNMYSILIPLPLVSDKEYITLTGKSRIRSDSSKSEPVQHLNYTSSKCELSLVQNLNSSSSETEPKPLNNHKYESPRNQEVEVEHLFQDLSSFVDLFRYQYKGIEFRVGSDLYYVNNAGYVVSSSNNRKVATGLAKDIYRRLYENWSTSASWFEQEFTKLKMKRLSK